MRCEDVIQELSAPAGRVDSTAVSDHLAQCPQCALWAERDAKVDRLWEATRPAALSSQEWDSIWTNATEAAERLPRSDVLPMPVATPRFSLRTVWVFGFAQVAAAATILIVLAVYPGADGKKAQVAQNPAPPVELVKNTPHMIDEVEVDQGEFPVFHFDSQGKKLSQTDLAQYESPARIGSSLELYNELEGNAGEGNVLQ